MLAPRILREAPVPDPTLNTSATLEPLTFADFTELVERHERELYGFLRGMVRDAEQARDLLQDTFYDGWRAVKRETPPFDGPGKPEEQRRWLYHAAYCRAVSALRRHRLIRWESLHRSEAALEAGGLLTLAAFEDAIAESEAVSAALADLAPEDSACLLLTVVRGFTAVEAAEILGTSPQATARRVSRAKRRLLTVYLAQNGDDENGARP
ncbi:MAG TPA: sigma-70 family RNA polymerase sigma factor [Ktedonobacterales bacterium]|nr:sigma-70 family RNA polymerase sigma factor [Ktedonobacterales bacterium]